MNAAQRGLANHLLAWARTELQEQAALLSLLVAQERSVSGGAPDEVERATLEVSAAMEQQDQRRQKLSKLLGRLAEELGVSASLLTLGSAIERLGGRPRPGAAIDPLAAQLSRLRLELREQARQVVEQNRRVARAIGVQRGIVREVLSTLLSDEHGDPVESEGTLIDARA